MDIFLTKQANLYSTISKIGQEEKWISKEL